MVQVVRLDELPIGTTHAIVFQGPVAVPRLDTFPDALFPGEVLCRAIRRLR